MSNYSHLLPHRDKEGVTDILEDAKSFADENLRPFASEFDQKEGIPREVIDAFAQKGYLGATFPIEYGGLGLDAINYGLLTEIIGRACCSTRALLTVHTSIVGGVILRWGSLEQKKKYLPRMACGEQLAAFALSEPETGSDAKNIQTNYRYDGKQFIIEGRKKWITFGHIADIFLVIARSNNNTTAFLVERDHHRVKTKQIRGLLGSRGAYVAEVELNGVRVPEANVLGGEGSGTTFIIPTGLDYGRYSIAWGSLAIATEALSNIVKYSQKRSQFDKKLFEFQLVKQMIANAVTKTHAARTLCLNAGKLRIENHPDAVMETNLSKYYASEIACDIASDAVQVFGGNGCSNIFPVERLFREAKIMEIIEGTSQIQQILIARYGFEKYSRD